MIVKLDNVIFLFTAFLFMSSHLLPGKITVAPLVLVKTHFHIRFLISTVVNLRQAEIDTLMLYPVLLHQ